MRYVAAYLLAVLGGNTSPSAKDIKAILGSVGIEADDERLNKVCHLTMVYYVITKTDFFFSHCMSEIKSYISLQVISELNGKDINEVMNSGLSKLASVPAGGAVVAPAAAAAGGTAGAGAAPAAVEEKKEEKKEESEESDEDMGFGLFD
ncbi:60S acidic ribosomal protein P2 isoform X1 [Siniperca chuatsi]|uniref:60S acidic ribosomal protein P2 isoform X1 n=1 Tax=Siniperca chuatsi TaxID=119488 RepID=UPI001CE22960|nr:60S acidic ribosomal protein P2 isoform X1 [Siniperca chuatsi]